MSNYKSLLKIVYSVIASELILISIFGLVSIFKVTTIETNLRPSDFRSIPEIAGKTIFFVDEEKAKNAFMNIPYVKEIKILKKYPNTIIVNAVYREKVAQITGKNGTFLIDEDGVIFEKATYSSASANINLSDRELSLNNNITQKNIIIPLKITKLLKNTDIQISSIIPLTDDEINITLSTGTLVVIGSNTVPEEFVSSLQMIVRRFTIEGKSISKIDFRFDKPIVTY